MSNPTAKLVEFHFVQWEGAAEVPEYFPGFVDKDFEHVTKALDDVVATTEKAQEFYRADEALRALLEAE